MEKDRLVTPVVKWVGGKRQLLDRLIPLMPKDVTTYCEPFLGGGALFFSLQPDVAYINDINTDLMNVYNVIKTDVEELIKILETYRNEEAFFYSIRNIDRDKQQFEKLSDVQKAARILYLNKTCYNGLYRVNRAGEYNTPFGRYVHPNIVNAPVLRAVNKYFNSAKIFFYSTDYANVLDDIPAGAFAYLDPPYDPVSDSANFTAYSKDGFNRDDQIRLRECCDKLTKRGVKFMLSNSSTDFIRAQYSAYKIITVQAARAINSVGDKRGKVDEVVVINYA